MSVASYQPSSPRRRAASIALAVAAHLVVLLVMLRLAPGPVLLRDRENPLTTFQVLPEPRAVTAPTLRAVEKVKHASGGAPRPALKTPDAPASTAPVPPPPPFPELIGGKEMFEAADVSKIAAGKGTAAGGTGQGKDSGAAYGPGEGPGGERLYNAEWYREPTRAELAFYMPPGDREPGWALIACRTVERYHVENCRALGESPVGSGLARTLRLASWQFLVRPPRVGGKSLVGAWVRIRFDFTVGKAE